jgi:hypothetical protein
MKATSAEGRDLIQAQPRAGTVVPNIVSLMRNLEPVECLSWLLSPFHGESPKFTFHQFHFGDHRDIVSLMRNLEGVPNLFGVVQASLDIFMYLLINQNRIISTIEMHSKILGWREKSDYAFYDSKKNSLLHQSVGV